MSQDLVIGSITNYSWDNVKVWVNSLIASGYTGKKMMIVFNGSVDLVDRLVNEDFIVYAFKKEGEGYVDPNNGYIMVDRFFHIYNFLNNLSYGEFLNVRNVIATDVGDVVFQRNPSELLDYHDETEVILSSEGLRYKHEPWGDNNMRLSFPAFYETMKDRPIFNAGVICAKASIMKMIAMSVYLYSRGTLQQVPGGGGPDQAALNILFSNRLMLQQVAIMDSNQPWALQAGTMADPAKIAYYRPNLLHPEPVWKNNQVCTPKGEPYAIVHQYNRVPEWKAHFERIYG